MFTLSPCQSVQFRKTVLSITWLWQGQLHNQLTHSADTDSWSTDRVIYLKQRLPIEALRQLQSTFFPDLPSTLLLPMSSEPSSIAGACWLTSSPYAFWKRANSYIQNYWICLFFPFFFFLLEYFFFCYKQKFRAILRYILVHIRTDFLKQIT